MWTPLQVKHPKDCLRFLSDVQFYFNLRMIKLAVILICEPMTMHIPALYQNCYYT